MSKYGIFLLGITAGAVFISTALKKGRKIMATAVLERIKLKCAVIDLIYDEEVNVWIAMSQDVPGLVLESDSKDKLKERVRLAAPELLQLNGVEFDENLLMNFREVERVFK